MSNLQRHVPRLALEWAATEPDARWRLIDGTLCFADVSGFTALAERLAQRGRMGGEELVETLGGVFASMIEIARERGGSLLKFGGDALLLFFQGPDHAVQAASAAVEMRKVLREAAKTPTSVGPLKLSMSMGLHSGQVYFFLVGKTHRELILLGPAANRIAEVESAANAGEIVVSAETGSQLPRGAVVQREDGMQLLRWRKGAVLPSGKRGLPAAAETLAQKLFPSELGAFLAPAPPDPEHRVACIAFIRFSGTDTLLENRGPEVLAAALDATIGRIQEVLIDEGVTLLAVDLDRDGGKLFMAAGVPQAHEDDEGVMLRALRRIVNMDLPLPLQIGVNRGHVFAAEIGDEHRAAFSTMGDTTNTAARIAARTPPGMIYAHPEVLDECQTLYEATPVEPLHLKGKAAPLVVYQVGAEIGLREREGLSLDEVVGREPELSRIRQAISQLKYGVGGVLSLTGDTGLGKTRLIREVTEDQAPCLMLRGEPYGANSSYRMLRDAFRELLGIERGRSAEMRNQLETEIERVAPELLTMLALIGEVLSIPVPVSPEVAAIDPRFRPDRTADVVIRLLAALVPEPLTIVVDEAHWCDEATARLLSRVELECAERPWLMIVARRDAAQGFRPEAGETLMIGPMSDEEIRLLVRIATDAAPLRSHEVDAVVRRAGGYPLFAEEIIRAVREFGSLEAVPISLEAAMAAQVDALDRSARRVLQYASVLGRSFSTRVLAMLLDGEGHELDDAHLDRLDDYLIREGEDRMQFRSGMLRDTVYEGVAYRLRRRLHLAAGEDVESQAEDLTQVADLLAMHFSRAGDLPRTWRYGCMAGDRARDSYANADAARFYELALEAARKQKAIATAELQPVWLALGEVQMMAGMFDASLRAHREALKLARRDPVVRASALFRFAKARDRFGTPSSALRDLTKARSLIETQTNPAAVTLAAEIAAFRANVLFGLDRLKAAIEQTNEAVELSERASAAAPLAGSLLIRDSARTMLEGPGEGADFRRALQIYEELGELVPQGTVLTNLGVSVAFDGRWQEALEHLEAARDRYERGGNTAEAALTAHNIADLKLCQGHVEAAARLLAEALPVVRAAGWRDGVCGIQLQMSHVLIERGEFAEADELLETTAQEYHRIGRHAAAAEARVLQGAGKILAGSVEQGLEMLDSAVAESGGDLGMLGPREALLRAIALARLSNFEQAKAQCLRGIDLAREFDLRYELGLLSQLAVRLPATGFSQPEREELLAQADALKALGVEQIPRTFIWPVD